MQLRYIDSLRGIAILGVILVHTSQYGTSIYTAGEHLYPGFINRIFEQGARGVQLFYVVSAFTLFLSYYYRKASKPFSTKEFFIRRIFRVTPIYWVAILYFSFIQPAIINIEKEIEITSFISNVFLMNSLHPGQILVPGGWTISVEMLFYCMLPLLYKYITNTNKALLFTTISLFITILYNFLFFIVFTKTYHLEYFHFTSLPNQLPLFGFGIIAFFVGIKKDYSINPYLLLTIGLMLILQLTLVRFIPNHILFGVSFMLLVIIGERINILKNKILVYIGKISYSAYFVHFAVLSLLNKFGYLDFHPSTTQPMALANMGIRFSVVLAIVIMLSTLTYFTIELPTQNFGKKLIKSLQKQQKVV